MFPAIDQPDDRPETKSNPDISGWAETVLVVDDNPEVLELAASMLTDLGYSVLTAGDGHSALEIIETNPHVDVLFTDVIMPGGMNGVSLALEARRRLPRLRVLLTSGFNELSNWNSDHRDNEFELLTKPYRRNELARRLRGVLGRGMGEG